MNHDFTLIKYARLCHTIQRLSCPVMTVKEFLETGQSQGFAIILRHDIDRTLSSAMRMAELEMTHGIRATYYARVTRAVFQPPELKRLSELGHEVGYHYEVLARAKGDVERAVAMFERELEQMRRVVPVHTVSMHGSPLSPWNNLDLWRSIDLRDFDLLGDASLSVDYSNIYYFTDTGRSWDATRYNLRDRVPSRRPVCAVRSTDELIDFVTEIHDSPVCINAHPNRWTTGWLAWSVSLASDWVINQAKWLISLRRR
jgi:hypothetical protein